jgi:class 3 adenylate cyclase
MESNWRNYTSDDSDDRLREILEAPAGAYEELDYIPDRARLTYTNGFYVNCTAVFVDIRGSSNLTSMHTTPVLGKIYRAYISECIALLNTYRQCKEIFIAGDCVSGIFNTPSKADILEALVAAASLNSLINHLNWRFEMRGYTTIKCGIGMSYGRALMLKSGYTGSGLNDVVWMGNVVNDASNLCHQGNKNGQLPVQVATVVYQNLDAYPKSLLSPVYESFLPIRITHYQGDVIHKGMQDWLDNKKTVASNNSMTALMLLAGGQIQTPPHSSVNSSQNTLASPLYPSTKKKINWL